MSGSEKLATEEKQHEFNLSQQALHGFTEMVKSPEWAKAPKEQRKAFRLRRALPKIVRPAAADDAWGEAKVPEFKLTETLRDTGKKCLTHFSELGKLMNNETVEELFDAFGVYE